MFRTDNFHVVDVIEKIPSKETYDWSLRHLGIEKISYKGKEQRVGILDTGCDINHDDLSGQVKAHNFIKGNWGFHGWQDYHGHGTFCSGEILAKENKHGAIGVAPQATGFHGKILYGDYYQEIKRNPEQIKKDIANAIYACIEEDCHVISMSFGSSRPDMYIREALVSAVNQGIIPVAAAGNSRLLGSMTSYPAGYENVISVAAANKKDLPQWFSSIGDESLTAEQQPELAVASLEYYWGLLPGNQYGIMIGTSQATPVVAGILLLWRQALEEKGLLPSGTDVLKEARAWLRRVVNDTNQNGWDPELGFGVLLIEEGEI